MNAIGTEVPGVPDAAYFAKAFDTIQSLIREDLILAGHDISAGGLITTLLEMTFGRNDIGLNLNLDKLGEKDIIRLLFSEKPGVVIQVKDAERVSGILEKSGLLYNLIGNVSSDRKVRIAHQNKDYSFDINSLRDTWYRTSYLLDRKQCGPELAGETI